VIALTRAELLKIRSTRTTLGLLLGLLALVLLGVLLTGFLDETFSLSRADTQRDLLGIGSVASLFAAIAGVLVICGEYRFGTIRPTLLFTPRRSRVLLAKLGAGMLAGLAFGVVAEAIAFALGSAILSTRGVELSLDGGDVALIVLGSTVGAALWAGIGVGLGSIMRNQVASIVGLLAWVFLVDNLLFGLAPSVGRYTPSMALNALLGRTDADLVSPGAGAALLVVWAAALVLAGIALTARRDVN
jgi:ABC-type transport system involved in multi-copper enzyme maturation permease subunit